VLQLTLLRIQAST